VPNRIIKESICASEEIDALTSDQEVFFYRLMVVVDDFGLMDARPAIIKAKCYPLKSIDINYIQVMLSALQTLGLIRMYMVSGKPYLSITNWAKHQQIRAKRAKYPMPDQADDSTCNQLISDAPVIQSNPIQSESNPNPIPPEKPARFEPQWLPTPIGLKQEKWVEWVLYRSSVGKKPKQATWEKQIEFLSGCIAKGFNPADLIDTSIRNGWTGLFEPKQSNAPPSKQANRDSYAAQAQAAQDRLNGGQHEQHDERDITGQCSRVTG
jgi:hypothetical protein